MDLAPEKKDQGDVIWTHLFPSVRRQERERFLFFFLLAALLVMGQTLGLVGAESLLLSHLGAKVLPPVFILASCSTVVGSLIYAVGVDNARNDNYFIRILGLFSVLISVSTLLAVGVPSLKSYGLVALFCLYYANFAICTNHYWTFTGDFFDTLGAKRLFPLFTVGSSLGGLCGGIVSTIVASQPGGATALLWGWVVLSLMAAAWLRYHKASLRRWGPLEIEESDETSMDGVKSSIRYLRNSRLGRLMVVSALFMVTSLFVSQYMYSGLFAAAFPNSDDLAGFFGMFLAAANAFELILEVSVTPMLLRRAGIANTNLVHPALTLLSFVLLGLAPGLASAVFARLNRETLENALAAPVRNLIFNALPARLRGRMRAFLEGMVVYSGMALAGLFLVCWEQVQGEATIATLGVLSVGGFVLACGFLATNYALKKDYLEQLLLAIREGRVELSASSSTLESLPARRLAELWKTLSQSGAQLPILEELSRALALRQFLSPLQESFATGDSRVRLVCLQSLVSLGPMQADLYLRKALKDESPRVRLYALRNLTRAAAPLIPECLGDPDPEIRAEAASRCQPVHEETLSSMLESSKPGHRLAALSRLPESMLDRAHKALESSGPEEVQAALKTLCRYSAAPSVGELKRLYSSPAAKVRLEALRALVDGHRERGEDALELLSRGLSDPDREVRHSTVTRFVALGPAGRPWLEDAVSSAESHRAHSGIRALAQISNEEARPLFAKESVHRAKRAWLHSLEAAKLEKSATESLADQFLVLALKDSAARDLSTCFRLLEAMEEPKIVLSVEKVLRFAHARIRADALEVLSNLGVRESTAILVHLLEEGDIIERERALAGRVPPPRDRRTLLAQLECCADRWLRLAAHACLSEEFDDNQEQEPGSPSSLREEVVLMEHLLMLQSVPLFATMTLEQLEAIHLCLSEQHYTLGEHVFAEGDVGDEMYIVAEGEIEILIDVENSDPLLLATVAPGSYFGEMAILDNEPRSATARVSKDARLLTLKGEQLKELVYVMPDIAFTIFKVLSQRLRKSDRRLDSVRKERKEA